MKKKYFKPLIVFDSFQLDAALAVGCQQVIAPNTGVGWSPDGNYFLFNSSICYLDVTDLDGNGVDDGVCYHGPVYAEGYETYTYS